jgi:hypothetical protein
MPHALSRRLICTAAACTAAAVALSLETGRFGGAQQAGSDPCEFLAPSVVVSARDRADLDRDQVSARVFVDMRRGFFGAFVRGVLEDRVERQAPLIVRGLRARLESGNPPDAIADPFAKGRPGVR